MLENSSQRLIRYNHKNLMEIINNKITRFYLWKIFNTFCVLYNY